MQPDKAKIEAFNIPWPTVGCILEAVAKFAVCETGGGDHCAETLVSDLRKCLGLAAPKGKA